MSAISLQGGKTMPGASAPQAAADPFDLANGPAYRAWRDKKLQDAERALSAEVIEIADLARPDATEMAAISAACAATNMAIYRAPSLLGDENRTRAALAEFAAAFGLKSFEEHRSSAADGIVPIEVTDSGGRAGFIPYSDKAINWHTDGYYSYKSNDRMIRSMVLHCVRNAAEGGENGLLDQDIAYIRLRDANPAYITALMHPQAMTIPAFEDEGGASHGEVAGPVFVASGDRIAMRYTIRKRNVIWRDDPVLAAALAALSDVLANDPLIRRRRLSANEGVICNNVLHDRKAFTNTSNAGAGRLLYRIRSYNAVRSA
ncbi:MAG: TauD/TfdA family dioxygenase [Rhizobiaceae bacterium]